MLVSNVMTEEVFAVAGDTSLETAARMLTTRGISGAPVISPKGDPIGVVSLSDLADPDRAQKGLAYPLFYKVAPSSVTEIGDFVQVGSGRVDEVMTPAVYAIDSSATLSEAGAKLIDQEVHRLLVIDDGELRGIVSSLDVLRGLLHETA